MSISIISKSMGVGIVPDIYFMDLNRAIQHGLRLAKLASLLLQGCQGFITPAPRKVRSRRTRSTSVAGSAAEARGEVTRRGPDAPHHAAEEATEYAFARADRSCLINANDMP